MKCEQCAHHVAFREGASTGWASLHHDASMLPCRPLAHLHPHARARREGHRAVRPTLPIPPSHITTDGACSLRRQPEQMAPGPSSRCTVGHTYHTHWPLAPAAAAQLVTHTSHFNHCTVGHTNHAQGLHKIGTCHTCHTCCHTCHTCCHTCHTCCHTCHTCRTQWPPSCSLPTAATANCCHCKP